MPHAELEPVAPQNLVLNRHTPREPAVARLVKNEICTATRKSAGFARHVSFDVSGSGLAGVVRPGQCFGVIPPGVDSRGKPHKLRLYSSSSPTRGEDGKGEVIATVVKRLIDEDWESHKLFLGLASNYLCDLQEGEEVLLTGPSGKRFVLPSNADQFNYVFFATGTGIAPFRGMVMDLLERGVDRSVVLVAGSPYASDLLYHTQFMELSRAHENFTYLTAVSRQKQEDGHGRLYVHDRLTTNADELRPILEADNTLVYICGLTGMELGIYEQLAKQLNGAGLQRYLEVDPKVLDDVSTWERSMVGKQIRRTHRVMVEVYD